MARAKKTVQKEENLPTMTQAAFNELTKELDHRRDVQRKDIAEEIAAARALGDLSENHAYTVAMEKKELNENRINELESLLAIVKIVNEHISNDEFVSVGEPVEIQNMISSEKRVVVLVGSEETKSANPSEGKISTDSPIGKAIHNSKIGQVVDVKLPAKVIQYKILKFVKTKAA